jgi:hypothetical protein
MGAIQVKRVPPDLHEAVRRRAAAEGMTVSEYILDLVRKDLATPSLRQWLRELERQEPVDGVDVLAALQAEREARDERHA